MPYAISVTLLLSHPIDISIIPIQIRACPTADADAYTVTQQGELEIFNQVKELEPKEDVLKALRSPQD